MRRLALIPLLLAVLVPAAALAGGNTVHTLAGVEALGQGELDALTLDAEGILRPGPAFDATPLDADRTGSVCQSIIRIVGPHWRIGSSGRHGKSQFHRMSTCQPIGLRRCAQKMARPAASV